MSQEQEQEQQEDEGETLARALGDAPWCPLASDGGAVRHLVRARVWADGYALAATDLARVWACRAHGAAAVAAQLAAHNPHLECTPARAAQLLAAALRPHAREPLGSPTGPTAFTAEETPLSSSSSSSSSNSNSSVLVLRLTRRLAGYCFRWAFVCRPLGLGEESDGEGEQGEGDVVASQRVQAAFLRAQLLAPALRVGAVALAALQAAVGPAAALDTPRGAAAFVARLGPAVLAAPPCTGALAAALFRRCAPCAAPEPPPPSQAPAEPEEADEADEAPDESVLGTQGRPRAAKRPRRQGFV